MTETALSAGNGYREFVREVFIDPIRAVTLIDDEFPTLDDLLAEKLNDERRDVETKDCKRVQGILNFCRDRPRNWLVDIHDGGRRIEEIQVASHLSQSDLLILDYQLDKKDQSGDKAIGILRELAENDHFNLVVVYTQAASAGKDELEKIVREITVGLTHVDPSLELHSKVVASIEAGIEEWQDVDSDIEEKLLNAVDEITYLEYRHRFGQSDVAALENIGSIKKLLSILDRKPEGVRLREKQSICWALKSRQDRLNPHFSPEDFGRVNFKLGPVGANWIRTDRMFVTMVDKDTASNDLPDLVLSALSDWDPAPHRLLMSKMRAELDNKGVPVESEILNDRFLQAG